MTTGTTVYQQGSASENHLDPNKVQNIQNFRGIVGLASPGSDDTRCYGTNSPASRINDQLVFRSATLADASEHDVRTLAEVHNIRTIIDLAGCSNSPGLLLHYTPVKIKHYHNHSVEHLKRYIVRADLIGPMFKLHMWNQTPGKLKTKVILKTISGHKQQAEMDVAEQVQSKRGLLGMYEDIIDFSGKVIVKILHILTDFRNYPVLIHCEQGKDRTGIVIALLEATLGFTIAGIAKDYAKSAEFLDIASRMDHVIKKRLDKQFAEAPAEIMEQLLGYINNKYGSVSDYLVSIGFDKGEQKKLIECLAPII